MVGHDPRTNMKTIGLTVIRHNQQLIWGSCALVQLL
jgi:hypothetical protein